MKLRMKFDYELRILVRMNWKRMWLVYGMIFIFGLFLCTKDALLFSTLFFLLLLFRCRLLINPYPLWISFWADRAEIFDLYVSDDLQSIGWETIFVSFKMSTNKIWYTAVNSIRPNSVLHIFFSIFFKEKSIQYFIIHLSAVSHLSMSSNMITMWPFIPLYGWIALRNIVNACWVGCHTISSLSMLVGLWAMSSWFFFRTLSYAQFNGWVSLLALWKMV